ncbi:DUF3299 domain-containing protein [Vibrio splendidus]|uniref:DUF3299 domain-containing protein n=1 Tax=Vibrio splendidus TaxID=29497 RepID=A0A2N7M175_VIBSP|nr:DUF3299 domain-containing protein [Vibrio splendidus]MCW4440398.1 DUF3299 domain-containing protein [Vibrio splendidus]MDP2489679.1 DUF3299 domain-containing protein [Vibrio splendidus]PMF18775.1 hypothetical protein BCV19_14970 [Vibrio splendidus]PMN03036.1 hypothetical protein BCT41_08925 [Vibrio splendidus]PMO04599.1 hypothetical protein BCT19_02675 [Vibrio splendidus]
MVDLKSICSFLMFCCLSFSSLASEIKVTYWDELVPNMELMEDPFQKLDRNQMFDMATIARFKEAQSKDGFAASDEATQEIVEVTERLRQQNVDVEALFVAREQIMKQREALGSKPNTEVVGSKHRIPGYITPIEMDGTKVTKFFLVPSAGACIHTPPPPANQLVLIDYPQGIELVSLMTPVWVEGQLTGHQSKENVNYSDGAANVQSVYAMKADGIEQYQP